MYNYSPIKTMYIKNFRNLGEVTLDFSDSPIIALTGENESGKTSCVKAFAVCALHAWPRDQKDYIRDGSVGFGVAIQLEDGSMITRMKTNTTNVYRVVRANGEIWEANKLEAGVPLAVQELMGLTEEPETKEFLQIRTYEDQLLFVVSPASTNYKVMYDALKVDQLTRAIKFGSNEANALKSKINENEVSVRALMDNLKSIKLFDIEPLVNIKNRLKDQLSSIGKLEHAIEILNRIRASKQQLGAMQLLNGLDTIDMVNVNNLESISRLMNERKEMIKYAQNLSLVDSCEFIDLTVELKLENAITRGIELGIKQQSNEVMIQVAQLGEINEYEVGILNRAIQLLYSIKLKKALYNVANPSECKLVEQADFDAVYKIQRIAGMSRQNNELAEVYSKSIDCIEQLSDSMKQMGAAVVTCPKCGEAIVLDTENI